MRLSRWRNCREKFPINHSPNFLVIEYGKIIGTAVSVPNPTLVRPGRMDRPCLDEMLIEVAYLSIMANRDCKVDGVHEVDC